jgi:hypothetical protein
MRRLGLYLTTLIPAALLLLAFSGHRRGSFLPLRLVVSVGAALLALTTHTQKTMGWMWVMLGILLLFNPLVPIHLRRHIWQLLDLVAAGIFVAAAVALRFPPGARKATGPQ